MNSTRALPLKSTQEIFDETAEYLFAQEEPALNSEGFCSYLTCDGNRCAVGYWVPAEQYRPEWDEGKGSGIGDLVVDVEEGAYIRAALGSRGIDIEEPEVLRLMSRLQSVHDEARHQGLSDPDTGTWRHFDSRRQYLNAALTRLASSLSLSFCPRD